MSTILFPLTTDFHEKDPYYLDITPDGKQVWVSNDGSDDIAVIDTEIFKMIDIIPVPRGAHGITISPDGKTSWVVGMYVYYSPFVKPGLSWTRD